MLARLYIVFLVVVAVLMLAVVAMAHDMEHPELNGWFMGLESRGHMPCCDGSEAVHLSDPEWESHDGHYRVQIDGEWVDVPDSAVVDGPNRDGRAMVWPYYVNGHPVPRCFMPGSMS